MTESRWRRMLGDLLSGAAREEVVSGRAGLAVEEPVPARSGTTTCNVSLPSIDEPLHFNATISFEARWGGNAPAPPSLHDIAWTGIVHRAEEISRLRALTAAERLRAELNAALLAWRGVGGTDVYARGQCSSVEADADLATAVAEREKAQCQQAVLSWRSHERWHQEERMRSLLLDPLRATASWFLDNQDKPEHVVEVARTFRELRVVLAPEERADSAGQLLDDLLGSTDEAVRFRVVSKLRNAFVQYDREDLAARLDEIQVRSTGA